MNWFMTNLQKNKKSWFDRSVDFNIKKGKIYEFYSNYN